MTNRRKRYPAVCEVLEERMVLSHASAIHALTTHTATVHTFPTPQNTPPSLGPVGTLGDSYTDEYKFYPPDQSTARNWVEILHSTRLVSFGPYTTQSRGEPRDQGFAYNWARAGATSNDMINYELAGLTSQVSQGKIRYAWIFIGGNDFAYFLEGVQAGLIPPTQVPATLLQVSTSVETNFVTAVDTLLAANPNVKLVVSTLPDITIQPKIRQLAQDPQIAPLINATSQAIQHYNGLIQQIAAANSSRIAVVDLAATAQQLVVAAAQSGGTLPFGGTTISLTTGNDYHNFFLADGIHIGTVGQGIIADLFATAIDQKFGAQLFPLPPTEIVHYAAAIQHHTSAKTPA